jgi:hypothetical protein
MGGDNPKKALLNIKKAVNCKSQVEELKILNDAKDKDDVEQRVTDFCMG